MYGNTLHAIAAALFAVSLVGWHIRELIAMIIGLSLIIASACVVNCITDRRIDKKMERTKRRPLVTGAISVPHAIIYATILGVIGSVVLLVWTNWLAFIAAILCHVTYTVLYMYVKRRSWLSTLVGTIPGVLPVFTGYLAVDEHLMSPVWLLGAIILTWQLPHFYALALYRREEYKAAGLPVLSVVKPRDVVVQHILLTLILYVVFCGILFVTSPYSVIATGLVFVASVIWAVLVFRAATRGSDTWARYVFKTSLMMPILFLLAGVIAVVAAS